MAITIHANALRNPASNRQRLMKSFGMGLRTEGLEKKVEASFGCKMSRAQAVQLRSMIERVPSNIPFSAKTVKIAGTSV